MAAAALSLYREASLPQRLRGLAAVSYAVVFAVFLSADRPGLGLGQGFYVPIVLLALAGTAGTGVGAGLLAAALYELGLLVDAGGTSDFSSLRTGVHLVTYVAAGAIVGHFAARARLLLADSLHVLDDLLRIARRDPATGALDAGGLEAALSSRTAAGAPFGLLLGELADCCDDEAVLRDLARVIFRQAGAGSEVARIGPAHLAAVVWLRTADQARAAALELERALVDRGVAATVGWALAPAEGDGLALVRAASERLYARRVVRGDWAPTPASAGLV